MNAFLRKFACFAALICLVAALSGCPRRVLIVVSAEALDFGDGDTALTFSVSKNITSGEMPAIEVISSQPWISVLTCTSKADGCVSTGPGDPIQVVIEIDRSLLAAGQNEGFVEVRSEGLVSRRVTVRAFAKIIPRFSASDRTPFEGERVEFTNLTMFAPGFEGISYSWSFGNGGISGRETPTPLAYQESGSFTVALTVLASNGAEEVEATAEIPGFIVVVELEAPTANFTVNTASAQVNTPVQFTDTSLSGTAVVTGWNWDFGDGRSSTEQNPSHAYQEGGTYDVTLQVTSAHGSNTIVRDNVITITTLPPVAEFSVDNTNPAAGAVVNFTDLSDAGTAPITRWFWTFGDGGTNSLQNPSKVYTDPGTFPVSLQVTTEHGVDTVVKAGFITVFAEPPTAAITSLNRRALTQDVVRFEDASEAGTAEIETWRWEFGDGGTDTRQNPEHVYLDPGPYNVSLTVTTRHGEDSVVENGFITVYTSTPLDDFVRAPDVSFDYFPVDTVQGLGVTGHVLDLTSQTWRPDDVEGTGKWDHWLVIIEPPVVSHDTALLFIDGGNTFDSAPSSIIGEGLLEGLAGISLLTQSITAVIEQTPNQPLQFEGEPLPKSEDEIIAYTFRQFLDSYNANPAAPDNEWPVLFPMTKAAVRAMDVIQEFLGERDVDPIEVEDFIVSGASKRGWTTWLTAAADSRVSAIAPIVIDFLNYVPQIQHGFDVYGFIPEAVFDYAEAGIFFVDDQGELVNNFATPAGAALRNLVDPFEYRDRFESVPKLLINASGDQFFSPDSAQFYFDQLPGEKYLSYIPNSGHGVSAEAVGEVLVPWYMAKLRHLDLPAVEWEYTAQNRVVVRPEITPSAARLWTARSSARDFRLDDDVNLGTLTPWQSISIGPNGDGDVIGFIGNVATQWSGFFVQLEFPNPVNELLGEDETPAPPLLISTEIRITPDTNPVRDLDGPTASFDILGAPISAGDPVGFTDTSEAGTDPIVSPIIRWIWDFDDGSAITEDNFTAETQHTFAQAGQYDVSLTVKTVHGESTATTRVNVSAK